MRGTNGGLNVAVVKGWAVAIGLGTLSSAVGTAEATDVTRE